MTFCCAAGAPVTLECRRQRIFVTYCPGVPDDHAGSGDEVLVALVASLRGELAEARERIAELEARLKQTPRNSSRPPSSTYPPEPS